MGKIKYAGVGDRGIPLTLKEIVLIHLENLSNEIVTDGLAQEYEPALDRLMNWLFWEFNQDHKDDIIIWEGKQLSYPAVYAKVMDSKFGELGISDREKAERIRDKERLLSFLLAAHRITLGQVESYEQSSLSSEELNKIIPEDMEEDFSDRSRPDQEDSPKD